MLIDFVYSYAKEVLQDAQAYGEAAGKAAGSIGSQDIELAIRSRTFAQPISLQVCCVISKSGSRLAFLSGSLRKAPLLGIAPLVFARFEQQRTAALWDLGNLWTSYKPFKIIHPRNFRPTTAVAMQVGEKQQHQVN
jgi:hypothetical protein